MKNIMKGIIIAVVLLADSFLSKTYETIQTLINSRSAVQALKNSNESYIASQVFQFDGTMFYGVMLIINVLIIYLMFRSSFKINKKKKESEE